MIKKFNQFISESGPSEYLLYYAFDWDDNILFMPTVIHMERKEGDEWIPEDVSTAKFAQVRSDKENYRLLNDSPEDAFSDFRDNGPKGPMAFIEDAKKAVSTGKFGPAWKDFVECLSSGSLFAIITARGHESPTMEFLLHQEVVHLIIQKKPKKKLYLNFKIKLMTLLLNEVLKLKLVSLMMI